MGRRWLHQHPELGHEAYVTVSNVTARLQNWGVKPHHPTPTRVVAEVSARSKVLLHADMDVLPITEDTGLSVVSLKEGRLLACGRKARTAMLLGAAKYFSERGMARDLCVRFVFQHAE